MEVSAGTRGAPSAEGEAGQEHGCVCPNFHRAVELIGRRWTGAILFTLSDGAQRFVEIKATVPGVSDRLLSVRLKELEAAELVERNVHDCSPIKVSYELTEKGRSLTPVMESLQEWAVTWHSA